MRSRLTASSSATVDHLVVRSPGNPDHWWGNLILFDDPPGAGRRRPLGGRLRRRLRRGTAGRASERSPGTVSTGRSASAGASSSPADTRWSGSVGLIATPEQIVSHPRANREVSIRTLDPAEGADLEAWSEVVELQVAGHNPNVTEDEAREFCDGPRRRVPRALSSEAAARGMSRPTPSGTVVASCGSSPTASGRASRSVDTADRVTAAAGSPHGSSSTRPTTPPAASAPTVRDRRRPRLSRARPVRVARLRPRRAGRRRVPPARPRGLSSDIRPGSVPRQAAPLGDARA